jgi:hypothetical protein
MATIMAAYNEEKLGEILSALPPAPEAWVRAAQNLPVARRGLEEIVERAEEDEDYRRRVIEDPEAVLEEADVVAHADVVEILRKRLDDKK